MTRDQELYREIGQILYEAAPDESEKIVMRAKLVPQGDVCEFEYDYVGRDNSEKWFLTSDGKVDQSLREHLVALRDFFVSQNQPVWSGCEFVLNVADGTFSVRFSYG
ncbi:hypothetical protein R75465_08500 [Paraburkholderia aspalathi]|uniref:immunity protein YezG family protein n=1 Tax=Paraburkholderia aspalathi TaxID=1324617 RepID=UPI001B1A5DD4|nr:immunity protein YezG family protein [Paraburkholderia aspalathi]CAE6874295.1 hypothetical protein R75465_08500 [Paraburkholderia aspalathi]